MPAGEHHHLHLGVPEAQPLHRVAELDIHRQVVAVELQRVALAQGVVLVHLQDQTGQLTVDLEPPVLVAVGVGTELDGSVAGLRCHGGVLDQAS
jgi:hypothetical protein